MQAVRQGALISVQLLCRVAKIPRSSYYKWLNRKPSLRELENEQLAQAMLVLHEEVRGIFGYRRMALHLRRMRKQKLNKKRVQRLMRIEGIQSVIRRKKKKYTPSTPQHTAENLLARKFHAETPNEKWLTDVTEFKYGSQKAYLSAVLDLHDNTIVSHVLGHSNNNNLVFETVETALQTTPDRKPMLHSDRGFQYTSSKFKELFGAKLTQSMSRVGKCIDNGPMESFWGTLKSERYYLNVYNTYDELKRDIDDYIHFYNYERLQAKLNGLSPMEFRTKAV
ncbi:IS3 family transposase [Paenibacillus ginsengarvi]|uniref:IS3 family transposase n=1 Tax=Paenibacillus ginsengarvi TaxID=400777 RepID=UPI001F00E40D|nr:IS3 family transposase [Paenibacillus ginsengarvi]